MIFTVFDELENLRCILNVTKMYSVECLVLAILNF
ncbi:hypothetical protein PBAC_11760 [Pedobacter glucosidilyticus]|nr:hypothetical protein PBAC_11760 [Pedobacter glucosidilyticus]